MRFKGGGMSKSTGASRLLQGAMAFCLLATYLLPVQAADPTYQQAMSDFQARRFGPALAGFQKVAATNRSDILSHYYMALCYQSTNQLALAAREYQWVATYSKDPALKGKAQAGAAQLSKYAGGSSSTTTSSSKSSGPFLGMTAEGIPLQKKSEFSSGRLRVTEFYTQWCQVCKAFDPSFRQTQQNYSSKCDFQRLDAEDPSNRNLVEKYHVKNFPTTVMADSSGKPVNIFVGATNANGLGTMIDQAMIRLPH